MQDFTFTKQNSYNTNMNFNTWMEKQALSPGYVNKIVQAVTNRGFRKSYNTLSRLWEKHITDSLAASGRNYSPREIATILNKEKKWLRTSSHDEIINRIYKENPKFNQSIWPPESFEREDGTKLDIPKWYLKNSLNDRRVRTKRILSDNHARVHALKQIQSERMGSGEVYDAKENAKRLAYSSANIDKGKPVDFSDIIYADDIERSVDKHLEKYRRIFPGKIPENYLNVPKEFDSTTTLQRMSDLTDAARVSGALKTEAGFSKNYRKTLLFLRKYYKPKNNSNDFQGFTQIANHVINNPERTKQLILGRHLTPEQMSSVKLPTLHAPSIPGSDKHVLEQVQNNAGYDKKINTLAFDTNEQRATTFGHEGAHYLSDIIKNKSSLDYPVDPLPEEYFASLEGRNILKNFAKELNLKIPNWHVGTFEGLPSYVMGDPTFGYRLMRSIPPNARSKIHKYGPKILNNILPKKEFNTYLHRRFEQNGPAPDYIRHYIKHAEPLPDEIYDIIEKQLKVL